MYVSLLNKCRHNVMTLVGLIVVSFVLTGCIGQLPGDSLEGAENMDLTLAGDIERESRRNFSRNVVSGAVWNARSGTLRVQGLRNFRDDDDISILNATTGQILLPGNFRVRRLDDDDDDDGRRGIVLNNLSTIPCSITVTTSQGVQQIPVQNAPFNCTGAQIAPLGGVNITQAKWSNSSARLSVKGRGALPNQVVSVFDSATGLYLGSDQANSVGSWRVRVRNVFPIPCSISASANGLVAQARVVNSPAFCAGAPGGVAVPVGGFPPAFPSTGFGNGIFGAAPESVIQSPLSDLTIPVGTSINFIGYGFDPTNNSASSLNFRWSFGGTSFMADQTGPVADMLFTTPGIYYVTLTVSNSLGFSDPTPATRLVIVQDTTAVPGGNVPGTTPSFNPPQGYIVEPAQQQNIVITAGQALNFFANGSDPDSNLPLVYHWNFGGAAPNMTGQSPGAVIFSTPGVYMVSLVVADSTGVMDPTPDYRTVTVVGNQVNPGFNQPPQGMIISPSTDTQIPVGGSVNFSANGSDPENNTPLAYRWDFGGATSARTTQNPGQVTFNTPGTYYVTLTVSDSLGAFDPTPETRVIRVGQSFGGGVVGGINNLAPESLIVQPATDQTISVGQSVTFAGQGNDPELDTQLIYRWDFDGAMPSSLVQNPGAVTFNQPGFYRIRLAVSDSQGAIDTTPAVRNITVVGNGNTFNQPPNGVIIDPSINMSISVGQSLSFSAIGSDPEGSTPTYTWDFGGQIPNETGQVTPPITFNRAGVYRVTLIARDDQGARDSTPDVRVITVVGNSTAQPPVASIASPVTDITINQGSSVNFYGTGSSLGSFTTPLTYRWEVTGGFVSIPNANVASPGLVNFPTAGVYSVKFTVSDGLASDTVTRRVTVLGQSTNRPTATITATSSLPGVGTVPVGSQMQFNGTAFGGFAPYTYMWNFDGAVADSNLQNPSVTFNRPGAYDIKLYVSDSQGNRSLASAAYRVTVGNGSIGVIQAPQIVTNPPILNTINVGQTVNFSAFSSGGFGSAGQVYRWNFDGAVPNSLAQNPGNVTFNRVGTYYITLKVSDQSGATSSPATLAVNVVSNGSFGSPFPGTGQGTGTGTINAVIQVPSSNIAINCGVPFNFQAANLGAGASYTWTIKNGAVTELTRSGLNLSSLNATFNKAGSYTVELTASSNTGSDLTPDIRNFQVVNNGTCTGGVISSGSFGTGFGNGSGTGVGTGVGQAPNGNITSPVSDMTLRKGQSLNFVAQVFDPSGGANTGAWSFGNLIGAPQNSTSLNPGSITFTQTGVFVIRFTAQNSSGVSDPTPSIRVITVLP